MNNQFSRRLVNNIKESYTPGTRIVLNHMDDPYAPIESGTRGTVRFVDDMGQIHISWDNGRGLALVPGEDNFRKLTPEEVEAENASLADSQGLSAMSM